MKNTYKIVGAILLLVIYCFAIGFVAQSVIDYDSQSKQTTEEEKYFSSISANYSFSYAPKSSSAVNYLTPFSVFTCKNSFYELWVISKATEQLLETEFSQYTSFSRNFLIHYRKKDVIFPFHYFW